MLGHYSLVSAQESLVFYHQQSQSAYPISLIDSITLPRNNEFNIYSEGNTIPRVVPTDSLMFNVELPDTLMLTFHEDYVEVCNPHLDYIEVLTKRTTVNVRSYSKKAFVCLSKGVCSDGRVVIDADTTCTLILSDLHLSSEIGSTICLKQKQKARIVLADGTTNTLKDAQKYNLSDSTDTSNGCIYAKGSLTFTGSGTLNISGNYRHAIVSSKNITIEDGKISIIDTRKDGIHCDKYKQIGGTVSLHLLQMATKGIKVKEEFEMKKEIVGLRKLMAEEGIDAYFVPSGDFHGSEYVNAHFRTRAFLSGFTGSAGELLVTADGAWLWTDGRYFLQASRQLDGSGIELMKMGEEGVPAVDEFIQGLVDSADSDYVIGFDGRVVSSKFGKALAERLRGSDKNVIFRLDKDLGGEVWQDRPEIVPSKVWELPVSYAGRDAKDKIDSLYESVYCIATSTLIPSYSLSI